MNLGVAEHKAISLHRVGRVDGDVGTPRFLDAQNRGDRSSRPISIDPNKPTPTNAFLKQFSSDAVSELLKPPGIELAVRRDDRR